MSGIIKLWKDERGAVSPTVALSLVGLLASGGVAFDYAQLAAMDTELQQAADQAALAAATQLDGSTGACARAAAAASSLLTNQTRFANDGSSATVSVASESACDATGSVQFYQDYNELTDVPGAPATTAAQANVVIIQVGARRTKYAMTPIVGVFQSPQISAQAVASLSSAVCKVPPLMFCAPTTDFPQASDVGKGMLLEPGGGGAWVAGNYGYLDFGNGASGVSTNLGVNNEAAACFDNDQGIGTEPGNKASVTKALNSRFDLYPASATHCDPSTGNYCPSQNVKKDLSFTEVVDVKVNDITDPVPANPGCGATGAKVLKGDNNVDTHDQTIGTAPQGLPRDTYHVNGGTNKFGDSVWDYTAYMADAHPGITAAAVATALSKSLADLMRWDVYQWELADKANRLGNYQKDITASPVPYEDKGGKRTYTFTNRCGSGQPVTGTGVAAGANQKDRRMLTVAVVDCTGANGKFNAKVLRFADLFLVEPSLDRGTITGKDQIYAEIVRVAERANGQSAFQYYLRQRPRLLK